MKSLNILILILIFNVSYSQNYFEGKNLYCKSENTEANRLFNIGIETLHLNTSLDKKYLKLTSEIFFKAYKTDSTFCDALFFTGYSLRLLNDNKALAYYYMADSLANNRSIEFKANLAAEALKFGNEPSLKIAKKTYNELIKYFPESPEGYYGLALISTVVGDSQKGLENINIAIEKYKALNVDVKLDATFLKGVLLTLNKKYEEGLLYLEISEYTYKKDDNFRIHYSLCLLKVSELRDDEKMKKNALKVYNKIKNKDDIPEDLKDLFQF